MPHISPPMFISYLLCPQFTSSVYHLPLSFPLSAWWPITPVSFHPLSSNTSLSFSLHVSMSLSPPPATTYLLFPVGLTWWSPSFPHGVSLSPPPLARYHPDYISPGSHLVNTMHLLIFSNLSLNASTTHPTTSPFSALLIITPSMSLIPCSLSRLTILHHLPCLSGSLRTIWSLTHLLLLTHFQPHVSPLLPSSGPTYVIYLFPVLAPFVSSPSSTL